MTEQKRGDIHHADPDNATTDRAAADRQEQIKRDHDALEESKRRVESSVQNEPRTVPGRQDDVRRVNPDDAVTDPRAAARQERTKADHDALVESARRVESSVPEDVRNTPVRGIDDRDR